MMKITRNLAVPDDELSWQFARSGGPGGQNVNKVNSKALLRWNVDANTSLPVEAKDRLLQQQRRRINNDGELILTSQRYRDQERNRQDCLAKLTEIIKKALLKPKKRKKTKPTRASKEARHRDKQQRSQTKSLRRKPGTD